MYSIWIYYICIFDVVVNKNIKNVFVRPSVYSGSGTKSKLPCRFPHDERAAKLFTIGSQGGNFGHRRCPRIAWIWAISGLGACIWS